MESYEDVIRRRFGAVTRMPIREAPEGSLFWFEDRQVGDKSLAAAVFEKGTADCYRWELWATREVVGPVYAAGKCVVRVPERIPETWK